eukprot:g66.t1
MSPPGGKAHVETGAEMRLREGQMLAGKQMKNWENRCVKYREKYQRRTERWLIGQVDQASKMKRGVRDVEAFLGAREQRAAVLARSEGGKKKGTEVDKETAAEEATPVTTSTPSPAAASSPVSPNTTQGGHLATSVAAAAAASPVHTPQTPPAGTSSGIENIVVPFDRQGFPKHEFVLEQMSNRASGRKWKRSARDRLGGPINQTERTMAGREVALNPLSYFETDDTKKVLPGDKVPQSATAVALSQTSATPHRLLNQKKPEIRQQDRTAAFMRGGARPFIVSQSPQSKNMLFNDESGEAAHRHLHALSATQLAESKDILGPRYNVRKSFLQPWKHGPQRIRTEFARTTPAEMAYYDKEIEKAAAVAKVTGTWARERFQREQNMLNTLSKYLRRNVASPTAFAEYEKEDY